MNYFAEIETLGELKKAFRKLALEHHPDHGGDAGIMRDIICEYQRLAQILPDMEPGGIAFEPEEEDSSAENAPANEANEPTHFYCAYAPTSAGGANPHLARLATPLFSHKEICLMAKSLFVYGDLGATVNIQDFYRKLCRTIDPGQWMPYRDYLFNRRIAGRSLTLMKNRVLNRIFTTELWQLFKTSRANLQKAA